ncbi:MAG: hypothetical protein AAF204_00705 [Pseudomonadota bacterium]
MGSQNFLKVIGLKDDVDIGVAGTRFVECVREYVTFVENNPSEDNIEKEEAEVTALYRSFFPFSIEWARTERQKCDHQKNHEQANALKDKGRDAIDDLQANIIGFALCYMRIHRSMGLINQEMKNAPDIEDKKIKNVGDIASTLSKYRKERKQLIAAHERLSETHALLEEINPRRAAVEKCAVELYGQELGEKSLSTYRSGLRTGDFAKARKGLQKALDEKKKFSMSKKRIAEIEDDMKRDGEAYIAFLEKNQDQLRNREEKLYLKPNEVNVMLESCSKDIEQKETFIRKYYRPYLSNRIDKLKFLRTKLLVVGSLESLMTLYIRMMRGIAQPLEDIKSVRLYESEVIEHVTYLLGGQFQEMNNINERIEEILQEFNICVHDYLDVKN